MEYITVIKQFNQHAIANKLTGLQMQLWHEIFARVNESVQDLCISTAELLEQLQVSRCQFQRARSGLVQAGLLAMRKESNQKVYYTVQIDRKAIVLRKNEKLAQAEPIVQSEKATTNVKAAKPAMLKQKQYPKAADVIADGSYRGEVMKFCSGLRTGNAHDDVRTLETELMNWCVMRKENGWRLTMQGLKALLEKLKVLSVENVATMLEMVQTSIHRRWKGFYELRTESKPSGKRLLDMEQKAQQKYNKKSHCDYHSDYHNKQNYKTAGRLSKYDTKIEDLDYLEW